MKRAYLAAAALLLILLAGCATSSPSAGSNRPVCRSLATINSNLTSLSNAGDNVSVGQAKSLQSGISTALNAVAKIAPTDASSALSELTTANDQLGQTLAPLPDGDTLGQHGPQLQQFKGQVASAQAAMSKLATKLSCSS